MAEWDVYFVMGMKLLEKKECEKSIEIFNIALSKASLNNTIAETYYSRSLAYYKLDEDDKAIADLKKAADYGNEKTLEILKENFNIDYTPQKPSSSSAPNSGGSSAMPTATPKPAAQPARTPYPDNAGGISEEEFYQNEKTAKQGNADSCFIMGQAYMFNSYEKSEEWLNKAIALGNKEAKKLWDKR